MRNHRLIAKVRRVVGNRPAPSTFGEISDQLPRVERDDLEAALASMTARGSLVAAEDDQGVVRYATSTRWGGTKS